VVLAIVKETIGGVTTSSVKLVTEYVFFMWLISGGMLQGEQWFVDGTTAVVETRATRPAASR
jgi:hypothetical protein